MAAPTMGAVGSFYENESSTPSFGAPADVVAGSVVVIAFYLDGADTSITAVPSGFAHAAGSPLQVNPGGPGGNNLIVVAWKRFSGADAGPYTFTLSASKFAAGRAFRYDGCVAAGDPWDTNSGIGTAVAESGPVNVNDTPAVSMTTTLADETIFFVGSNWAGGTWTPPTGFTEQMDTGFGTSTVADKAQAVAGGTGSITATCTGSDKSGAWLGGLLSTSAAGDVPAAAVRPPQLRDAGETWWLQRDRRNANTVAAAADPLPSPLDVAYGAGGAIWHQRGGAADAAARTWTVQQRTYPDPTLLTPAATVSPTAQRAVVPRDYGEAQWLQAPRRDQQLLTTALLEGALLGGAETITRVTSPVTNAPRWWMPQQQIRQGFTPGLLDSAALEGALLAGDVRRHGHAAVYTDRREVPQQRPYISDPSFYPTVAPTDPLTVAWGAGGTYWQVYNTAAAAADRRRVPQQRAYISDPGLLATALLEGALLGSGDTIRHLTWHTDRREAPQQRTYTDPTLLATALLEGVLLGGADTTRHAFFLTDRRNVPQQPARVDFAGSALADPLFLDAERWRHATAAATHADRRTTVPQRIALVFVGTDPPAVVKANSTSNVTAGRTSTAAVTARRTSTDAVTARRTSSGGVS